MLNIYLYITMPFNMFPVQDTGLVMGFLQGDQSISFQAMKQKLTQLQAIVQHDPAVAQVLGYTGGRQVNSGQLFISLKPSGQRDATADGVVNRLRGQLAAVAGRALVSCSPFQTCAPAGE